MLMYLYGPDSYRRSAALREKILAPYIKKYPDGAVERFDLSQTGESERLTQFTGVRGLFAKVKLGIISEPQEGDKEFSKLLKTLRDDPSTTLVVISDKKLPKEFDFLLKDPVSAYEFDTLEGAQFVSFLKHEAASLGLAASDAIIREIAGAYEGDTWAAVTELQRISAGASAEAPAALPEFFPLIQSLKGSGPVASRLKSLWYLLETSEPAAVFNMLATLVSGSDKIKMADYDVAIKSGKLEYEEALLDFLLA